MAVIPKYSSLDESAVTTTPSAGSLFDISPVSDSWTFKQFNKDHHLSIFTPTLGVERFGKNTVVNKILDTVGAVGSYALGAANDLGVNAELTDEAAAALAGTLSNLKDIISGNGAGFMFQTYMTQHPNFGISNQYAEEGTLTKILNKTIGLGINVARLMGNFNPNYQIGFNFPQIWQDSKFQELQFQSQVNAFTIDEFKSAYQPAITYSDTTRGLGVMQVALISLAMAAPRTFTRAPEGSIAKRIIKSPPVIDVVLNRIAFRSCFVKEVTVEFGPKHEDGEGYYVDSLGFPMEAKINWNILIPIAQTQQDLLKTFASLGSIYQIEDSKKNYATFDSLTLRSDEIIRSQLS